MPKSFVMTASVYVDGVDTPEEATEVVDIHNDAETNMEVFVVRTGKSHSIEIVLPDEAVWEESGGV